MNADESKVKEISWSSPNSGRVANLHTLNISNEIGRCAFINAWVESDRINRSNLLISDSWCGMMCSTKAYLSPAHASNNDFLTTTVSFHQEVVNFSVALDTSPFYNS